MGRLSTLNAVPSRKEAPRSGLDAWRRTFGTTKEGDGGLGPKPQPSQTGGSYGRGTLTSSQEASFKRLLEAMRTNAPGGWSDDRYEQTRHQVGIQHIAIHRTGEQLLQAEFQVFHRDPHHPDGKRPVTRDDPPEGNRVVKPWDLVRLLERPNQDDGFGDLMYRWNQQLDLTGSALTWLVPNKLGTPMEAYVVPTCIAIPQPVVNPEYPDGYYRIQPVYPYGPFSSYPSPASAVGAVVPAQWMMAVRYPHPLLRNEGYSPLTALRLHIDEVEMMDRSRHSKMRGSINPSAVLQMDSEGAEGSEPLPKEEIDRIRAEWEAEFQGVDKHGRLIVTYPGGRLEEFGTKPNEMDYPAGWEQLVGFVMAGFGITKPAAGMVDDSSYSTLFATLKQFHLLTLEPKCIRIASKITRQIAPFFGDDLIVEIRCRRIDDHDIKHAVLNLLVGAKAITKGRLLRELEMPTFGDERDEDIAGEMPQPEQPGMPGQPGQPGQPGAEQGGLPTPPPLGEEDGEDVAPEPPEVTNSRPTPGKLGLGALGPRKSLYKQIREALVTNGSNGHGRNGVH